MKTLFVISLFFVCWIQPKPVVDVKYLQPVTTNKHQIINHKYFSLVYSDEYRQSYCSYYHLTKTMLKTHLDREDHFAVDSLVKGVHVKAAEYNKTGYDRGHLACQADMGFNYTAMNECFYMSNISPQVPGFNRGVWKKLEYQCRQWALTKGDIFIFTGGVLKPGLKKITKDSISVPEQFYKIVLYHNSTDETYQTIAFLLPNKDLDVYDLNSFVVPIDSIEVVTKIDFLNSLPDNLETTLERQSKTGKWIIN